MGNSAAQRVLAWIAFALLIAAPLATLSSTHAQEQAGEPAEPNAIQFPQPTIPPLIEAVWHGSDGDVLNGIAARPRVWGDEPIAITTEFYRESATSLRTMVYFDKGRLDILDPDEDTNNPWYVSSAALVREMISGRIQFGETEFVERGRATIPVVGDLNQPNALTYETLAPLAALNTWVLDAMRPRLLEWGFGEELAPFYPMPAIGSPVTDLLTAEGEIEVNEVPDSPIVIGAYDQVTKRNIAAPFADWAAAQPYPALYLLGHALTEPYWVDTVIAGEPTRVLFQAFERRIMTYNPNNPEGWEVESGNVGRHYRLWRNLAQPTSEALVPLAAAIPFGEEIVAAATSNLIDPHLLAAMALAASNGDPRAELPNGGKGLMGLRPETAIALGVAQDRDDVTPETLALTIAPIDPDAETADGEEPQQLRVTNYLPTVDDVMVDPGLNVAWAAREVRRWNPESLSFETIAADYYSGGNPDWNDPDMVAFVERVVALREELASAYPVAILPAPGTEPGQLLGIGHSAYYDPSYDRAWWERTLRLYESWGVIADTWADDPNGFYCVRPGYVPGHRLQLVANGVTITCTVGDMVADPHLGSWLAHWVIEMNYPAFEALGLDRNNMVEVYHLGDEPPPPVPDVPEPTPEPEPTPAPEVPEPTPEPAPTETPEPTATPEPTSTPEPTPVPPTPTPEPTATPTPTVAPTETPVPTATPDLAPTAVPSGTATPDDTGTSIRTATPGATPTE